MNKYANTYMDSLSKAVNEYKPFNQIESVVKGLPAAAAGGAGLGALIGGLSQAGDPGYDKDGNKKSRVKQILKGMALGGTTGGVVGGLGAAATPSLFQTGLDAARQIANANVDKNIPMNSFKDKIKNTLEKGKQNAQAAALSVGVPQMNVQQLGELLKYYQEKQKY
jgi:hypothetical protein